MVQNYKQSNNMKKINKFMMVMIALAGLMTSCEQIDQLDQRVSAVENDVKALQDAVSKMNQDITTLQGLVDKLNAKVTVDKVVKSSDGYTIYFSDNTTATISNGVDGKNGSTPVIGVAKDTDGKYYWTVNSTWLTDASGKKVSAEGVDGAKGNDGITPQVKVEGGYWYVSTDQGKTWTKMGISDSAEQVFSAVEETATSVVFTLSNGKTITIDKTVEFTFSVSSEPVVDMVSMFGGQVAVYKYSFELTGADAETEVDVINDGAHLIDVTVADDMKGGNINVYADAGYPDGKLFAYATKGASTIIKRIVITADGLLQIEELPEGKVIDEDGGKLTINAVSADGAFVEIPDGVDWITVMSTKAEVVKEKIVLNIEPNKGAEARSATITVTNAYDDATEVTIAQAAADATVKTAKFLGRSQFVYDSDARAYNHFHEYFIQFESNGSVVALAVNDSLVSPMEAFPTGAFTFDGSANHAKGTFTAKSAIRAEKYYTAIFTGETCKDVVDGTVTISKDAAGVYTIEASLIDEADQTNNFSYTGAIQLKDASVGAQKTGYSYKGMYNTYYTTQAIERDFSLAVSGYSAGKTPISYVSFTIISDPSTTDKTSVPAGSYFWADLDNAEIAEGIKSKTGIMCLEPGTFSLSANDDADYDSRTYFQSTGGMLVIAENSDGTNFVAIDATGYTYVYDDDYNTVIVEDNITFKAEYDGITLGGSPTSVNTDPAPDGDVEFTFASPNPNYMGWWYGDSYANGGQVFIIGITAGVNGNYSFYLPIQTKSEWAYTKNFNNRYCNTPIPDGVYEFAYSSPSDSEGHAINCIPNIKTSARKVFTNSYTGTVSYVVGGSLTIADGKLNFNITTRATDGREFHFTGGFPSTNYYLQDYSAASRQTQVAWATIQ